MTGDREITLSIFSTEEIVAHLRELGMLLHACVHAGASVSLVLPLTEEDSTAFWSRKVLPAVRDGGRMLWVAQQSGMIAGSVQLHYDTPPNQAHRAGSGGP